MRTEVIFEDDNLIVCYKPAGLATQTAKPGQPDVVSELKNYLAKHNRNYTGYLGIVHRLDQPVEGLLVFAKDKKTAAGLSAQLTDGALNKHYYATVCGFPGESEGELVDYLAKTKDNRAVVGTEDDLDNVKSELKFRKAVLRYKVIRHDASKNVSVVDIHIDTGRFHQIRVQMSNAGWPLLGDTKYGSDASVTLSRKLNISNIALCAYNIEFKNPISGKRMHFEIKPRNDVFGRF